MGEADQDAPPRRVEIRHRRSIIFWSWSFVSFA